MENPQYVGKGLQSSAENSQICKNMNPQFAHKLAIMCSVHSRPQHQDKTKAERKKKQKKKKVGRRE